MAQRPAGSPSQSPVAAAEELVDEDRQQQGRWGPGRAADLHRLVEKKAAGRYGSFQASGGGSRLPDGSGNSSGYVLDETGAVHYFVLGWDDKRHRLKLTDRDPVEDPEEATGWEGDPEYLDARKAAGSV